MQKPIIQSVSLSDLSGLLKKGVADFLAAPLFGLFFGGIYAAGGILATWFTFAADIPWLAYPLIIGFTLIGPFIAAGLYQVSRLLEQGSQPTWRGVLGVIWDQRRRELGWMAFVLLFVFWIWIYQVRILVAVFFGLSGFATFGGFLEAVLTTPNGWIFLIVGHVVGAFFSLVLFSATVISCPLLLERDYDFITAIITSVQTVHQSPVAMLCWACFVTATIILSSAVAFLGLLITLPILGHTTWHLYRHAIAWE